MISTRREFIQTLGAGLLIAAGVSEAFGQTRPARSRGGGGGMRGGGPVNILTRLHIGQDGIVTVMTGKVESGQGSRAEITAAAAEELGISPQCVQVIMGDTELTPDDGITAGSGTTPRTIPSVRQGAAGAKLVLIELAAKKWGVKADDLAAEDGFVLHAADAKKISYAELAGADLDKSFSQGPRGSVVVTSVKQWRIMGTPMDRPSAADLVKGAHRYPRDIQRPGMLYGKVLRPPSYGAKLKGNPTPSFKKMPEGDMNLIVEGDFVAVAASTTFAAQKELDAIAANATWEPAGQIDSDHLHEFLKNNAQGETANPFADDLAKSPHAIRQVYTTAYIQHAPLEPRSAMAEWNNDKLTIWTGTQNPFGVRRSVAEALGIPPESVRVIVPDFGGGFGGKHMADVQIEAARIAKSTGKPVAVQWTREEEFTWAYFRPAAVIIAEAGLDSAGKISSWFHLNINSGPAAMETPYVVGQSRCATIRSQPPLKQGSYRSLAAAANTFARESLMDELAVAAGSDPLAFRLAHIEDDRLHAVLQTAADKFGWSAGKGCGLACGTDKGSYIAACAQVSVDDKAGAITVHRVCQAFECGAIINPRNLENQNQGAIMMGLGAALREEIRFKDGKILNATFADYQPARFADLPEIEVHLLDRPDLPSAGAGETPIIAIAPAVANAVFSATGKRSRRMPI